MTLGKAGRQVPIRGESLPAFLFKGLRPYQQQALRYCFKNPTPAVFMDMRLGKTRIAVRWVKGIQVSRTLVICPLSATYTWYKELLADQMTAFATVTSSSIDDVYRGRYPVYIINFELLLRNPELCWNIQWDCVIVDESVRIKNPKAKITKLIANNFRDTQYRMILTGEPAPESELDYFSQYQFLQGQFMGFKNYYSFRNRLFFAPDGFNWQVKPRIKKELETYVTENSFTMTRDMAKVTYDETDNYRYLGMNEVQRKYMKTIDREFILQGKKEKSTLWVTTKHVWMLQLATGFTHEGWVSDHKLKELVTLLKGDLAKSSVVVWCNFKKEVKKIRSVLKSKGIKAYQYTGSTPKAIRKRRIRRFNRKQRRVFISIPKCAKYGMDLSVANVNIYFSMPYSYDDYVQSRERINKVGKSEPVVHIHFVTRHTIEEDVLSILKDKKSSRKVFRELAKRMKERLDKEALYGDLRTY